MLVLLYNEKINKLIPHFQIRLTLVFLGFKSNIKYIPPTNTKSEKCLHFNVVTEIILYLFNRHTEFKLNYSNNLKLYRNSLYESVKELYFIKFRARHTRTEFANKRQVILELIESPTLMVSQIQIDFYPKFRPVLRSRNRP